jgi:hypothetical protein
MPLSEELCEFLGVIIGDGCTNKYGNLYHTQTAGDKILDKRYYSNNLDLICRNVFNIRPKIVVRERGIYMNIYSKRLFEMLTGRFKIPAGKKCYSVKGNLEGDVQCRWRNRLGQKKILQETIY